MDDKAERWRLIGVLKMVPGGKDNPPNGEWQLPSSMGRGKITRCRPFIWWNWPFNYNLFVPQYRRVPRLDARMLETYSRGCRKLVAK